MWLSFKQDFSKSKFSIIILKDETSQPFFLAYSELLTHLIVMSKVWITYYINNSVIKLTCYNCYFNIFNRKLSMVRKTSLGF